MRKLNIGCGQDIKKGWVNLDNHKKYNADVIHDLNKLPLPFKDNHFDYIYCSYVLENFFNPVPLLKEMIRITKPKGIIEVIVPNETMIWNCFYHKRPINLTALMTFATGQVGYNNNKMADIKEYKFIPHINLNSRMTAIIYSKICSFFCNLFSYKIVDKTFIKYLFPFVSIRILYIN